MAEAITRPANQEWPWLLGAILSDGIVGPIRLMIGLARTDASAAALLLTLEGVAWAWFVSRENFDRRVAPRDGLSSGRSDDFIVVRPAKLG